MLVAKEVSAPFLARAHSGKNCRWDVSVTRTLRPMHHGCGTGSFPSCCAPNHRAPGALTRLPRSREWRGDGLATRVAPHSPVVRVVEEGDVDPGPLAERGTGGRLAHPTVSHARSAARAAKCGARLLINCRMPVRLDLWTSSSSHSPVLQQRHRVPPDPPYPANLSAAPRSGTMAPCPRGTLPRSAT